MKFLYVNATRSVCDIPWALLELNYEVEVFDQYEFNPLVIDNNAYQALRATIELNQFDFLISYIFFPIISNMCEEMGIPYISWTYDSPLVSLFDHAIYNPHNYTFIFDKAEYMRIAKENIAHLYHLPMATNLSRTGKLDITNSDIKKYSADISFVGHLYEDNFYNASIHYFPDNFANELKLYLAKNLCNWEHPKPWPRVSDELATFMETALAAGSWNQYTLDNQLYFGILLLTRKLAEMDRITVLNTLAQNHSTHLYTHNNNPHLQNVIFHESIDYYTEMNKVFYLSKINLNITLPSIETGLPQRIFDIMGCGGFVLTNYQEEIDDLFIIGEDIEVFHNLAELQEKADYYLSHEKERLQIAINGYKKVRDNYTYIHQMSRMLEIVKANL
ncbi:glycosyltransferase [Lachnospiraceae bacterium ZAX-1]